MLKIGLLHGCRQNSEMFNNLLKDYIKKIIKEYPNTTFFPIEGQYDHPEKGKMWFKTLLELDKIGTDDVPQDDINITLNYLENIIRENNINFLIGFSQGGNVISTYLRLRNNDEHIKKAIIISSYDFPQYQNIHISIPILLIGSKEDIIVKFDLLPINCDNATIFEHNKGHIINHNKSFITSVIDWIK
jgi:predicted esterase